MLAWLKKEPRGIWFCVGLVVLVTFFDFFVITELLVTLPVEFNLVEQPDTPEYLFYWERLALSNPPRLMAELFFVVVAREVAYRATPLFLAVYFLKRDWAVLSVAIVSSLIFAWRHEWGWTLTTASIAVSAMVFSLLYLKCGGWRGTILKPFFVAIGSHYLFNMLAFAEIIGWSWW